MSDLFPIIISVIVLLLLLSNFWNSSNRPKI